MHDDQRPAEPSPDGRGTPAPGARPPVPVIWSTWGNLRLLVWAVACLAANGAVQAATFALSRNLFLAVGAGSLLGVVAPCALLARAAGGSLRREFALDRPRLGVLFWSAVTAAASLLPTALLAELSSRLRPAPPEWEALYAEQLPRTPAAIALAYAAVVIAAPLAEELLFRGIVQRLTARVWGATPAALLAALAFALLHGEPWLLFGLIGIGLVLGFVWATTGSVTACAVAHGVHNAAALTMMLREGTQGAAGGSALALVGVSLPALVLSGAMLARAARRGDQR